MSQVTSAPAARKVCVKCGMDVTGRKRIKNASGEYCCESCYGQGTKVAEPAVTVAPADLPDQAVAKALGLLGQVTCPHCWHRFSPADILWVAQHSDLMGDPVLGPEKPRRFLPTRFTAEGQAIDGRGSVCQVLACPRCHLAIPRSIVEAEPLFISVVGGPKSGKSYFLASMAWELRRCLSADFGLAFNDADTVANQALNEYEATLFLPEDADKLVAIRKTELEGELYDQINLGGQVMSLPRPFLFNIRPTARHPNAARRDHLNRILCMYDNAGEHFQPGMDRVGSPVTQHLAMSRALMFLFDPTQDPRFRERCRGLSEDPQLGGAKNTQRQETLLTEASLRVRRYANLPPNAKHQRPLVVIVSKSDVWAPLVPMDLTSEPVLPSTGGEVAALDTPRIERSSAAIREMLLRSTPELVTAAEEFCEHIIYIPVSALGCSPEATALGEGKTGLFVRPKSIAPRWAAVPVLYMLAKWATGLIAAGPPPGPPSNPHGATARPPAAPGPAVAAC